MTEWWEKYHHLPLLICYFGVVVNYYYSYGFGSIIIWAFCVCHRYMIFILKGEAGGGIASDNVSQFIAFRLYFLQILRNSLAMIEHCGRDSICAVHSKPRKFQSLSMTRWLKFKRYNINTHTQTAHHIQDCDASQWIDCSQFVLSSFLSHFFSYFPNSSCLGHCVCRRRSSSYDFWHT